MSYTMLHLTKASLDSVTYHLYYILRNIQTSIAKKCVRIKLNLFAPKHQRFTKITYSHQKSIPTSLHAHEQSLLSIPSSTTRKGLHKWYMILNPKARPRPQIYKFLNYKQIVQNLARQRLGGHNGASVGRAGLVPFDVGLVLALRAQQRLRVRAGAVQLLLGAAPQHLQMGPEPIHLLERHHANCIHHGRHHQHSTRHERQPGRKCLHPQN
jgi:hypothetical protein